jgi:hypothetical protein
MAGGAASGRWGRVLRYTFGGALCLLVGINVLVGSPWYLCLIGAVIVGMIILGQRRIFRPGLSRSGDEIVCRYIPWYEGNAYVALVLLPLMGAAAFAAGCAAGNPAWLRLVGIVILGVTPLIVYSIVRMWRRCLLCITPSMLTVRLADRGSELTEIRRELVESIEPKLVPQPVSGMWLRVAVTYRPVAVGSDATKTVMLGPQLTVQPINLLNALVAWKDGANANSSELLDRVERVLRGRSMAGV